MSFIKKMKEIKKKNYDEKRKEILKEQYKELISKLISLYPNLKKYQNFLEKEYNNSAIDFATKKITDDINEAIFIIKLYEKPILEIKVSTYNDKISNSNIKLLFGTELSSTLYFPQLRNNQNLFCHEITLNGDFSKVKEYNNVDGLLSSYGINGTSENNLTLEHELTNDALKTYEDNNKKSK